MRRSGWKTQVLIMGSTEGCCQKSRRLIDMLATGRLWGVSGWKELRAMRSHVSCDREAEKSTSVVCC